MSRAVMRLQGVLLGVAMLLNLAAPPAARGGEPALACFRAESAATKGSYILRTDGVSVDVSAPRSSRRADDQETSRALATVRGRTPS